MIYYKMTFYKVSVNLVPWLDHNLAFELDEVIVQERGT